MVVVGQVLKTKNKKKQKFELDHCTSYAPISHQGRMRFLKGKWVLCLSTKVLTKHSLFPLSVFHIVVKEVLCTVNAGMKGKQKVVERSRQERGSVCPTEETFQNGNRPWDCRSPIQNTPQKALYQQQCFCSTEIQVERKSVCGTLFSDRGKTSALVFLIPTRWEFAIATRFHLEPLGGPRGMTKQHWRNHNAKYCKKP